MCPSPPTSASPFSSFPPPSLYFLCNSTRKSFPILSPFENLKSFPVLPFATVFHNCVTLFLLCPNILSSSLLLLFFMFSGFVSLPFLSVFLFFFFFFARSFFASHRPSLLLAPSGGSSLRVAVTRRVRKRIRGEGKCGFSFVFHFSSFSLCMFLFTLGLSFSLVFSLCFPVLQ